MAPYSAGATRSRSASRNFIVFVVTEGVVCGIRLGQGEEITFPADCGLC